jgi:CMP-N,N'-diacetyllegionaminic acid synthase
MNILAIIPARSGSKTIRDKNIRIINGKPLLAYSIEHALHSSFVTRVIVSTDKANYSVIAKKYGAEVPFIRPANISDDNSTDLEVFSHALSWLLKNECYSPDICVHLRPTYPIRDPRDIDSMIEILINNPKIDSVRSIVISPETPFKMWFLNNDGILQPIIECKIPEAYNRPRQILPVTYLQNACIDIVRTSTITTKHSMTGDLIYGYVMEHNWDIDQIEQLRRARKILNKI